MKPLVVDLFTGLHGWWEGFEAAGYRGRGYDLEDMCAKFGEAQPEGDFELVLKDIRAMHGSEIADADFIVGSSPCQDFSYRAMPWKRARSLTGPFLGLKLFHEQFRLQREASEAKGRYIPMVVENVRGAIPWVGRSRANFGSYHLWGDVPALMPRPAERERAKVGGMGWYPPTDPRHQVGACFNPAGQGAAFSEAREGRKVAGFRFDGSGGSFQTAAVEGTKGSRGYERTYTEGKPLGWKIPDTTSRGPARKAASAKIAKIPFTLAYWIAVTSCP